MWTDSYAEGLLIIAIILIGIGIVIGGGLFWGIPWLWHHLTIAWH